MASAPAPPAPVDPIATASAQGAANVATSNAQTAANNANVVTPYGSSTYNITGQIAVPQPDGSVQYENTYTNTQALSPAQQHLLNQNNQLSSQENSLAGQALTSAGNTLANPLTQSSFSPIQAKVGLQNSYDSGPTVQTSYNPGGQIQTGYNSGGSIQGLYAAGGPIQNSVGYDLASTDAGQNSNAPTTFGQTQDQVQGSLGNTDFTTATNNATNSILQRLQPSMDQQSASLNAQLANEGLSQGSDAYNATQLQNSQANNDLRLGAVQAGDQEQQGLYAEALQSGQFANSAQEQEYDQLLGRGQFAQAGIAQNNAASLAQANYGLSAIGQNNAARLNAGNFANSAQGQQNSENAALAAFGNQAQAQQYGENAAGAAFANAAQGQQNSQNAAGAVFGNQAAGQINAQNAAQAGFSNQARLAGAQFGNEAEQQQYTQGVGLNNNTVNLIDAFRSGGQVTAPQFQGYTAGQLDQTPISADTYSSANLAEQQYQAQMGYAGQTAAGMYGLGAGVLGLGGNFLGNSLYGANYKPPSDRRLKRNIKRVGTWRNGLPVYSFRYLTSDEPQTGFMADEVERIRPDAVERNEFGFASVDYEKAAA